MSTHFKPISSRPPTPCLGPVDAVEGKNKGGRIIGHVFFMRHTGVTIITFDAEGCSGRVSPDTVRFTVQSRSHVATYKMANAYCGKYAIVAHEEDKTGLTVRVVRASGTYSPWFSTYLGMAGMV